MTPRTDAEEGFYVEDGFWRKTVDGGTVRTDFARDLERELARALRVVETALEYPHELAKALAEWKAGR